MGLFNFFGNYNKPGPGVEKDEPPKAAPIRFFEIFLRKFGKLVQVNLIFMIPAVVVAAIMLALYFTPTRLILQIPVSGGAAVEIDIWSMYIIPLPLILLSPFAAGVTYIARNFAREEHAFIWSDFWDAVKNNWKYFLINGVVIYVVYFVLSFAMVYYYNGALQNTLSMIPFWFCAIIGLLFLFAQYYIPVMFVTFDLKFGQVYRNALIFILAGFGRNIIVTLILGGLVAAFLLVPIMPLTILLFLLLVVFLLFSFVGYLINFSIYPVIDSYLIQPYYKKLEEEKNKPSVVIEPDDEEEESAEEAAGSAKTAEAETPESSAEEDDEDEEDKYVFVNGRLIKASELKERERNN